MWRPSICFEECALLGVAGVLVLTVDWEQLLLLFNFNDAESLWDISRSWQVTVEQREVHVIVVKCFAYTFFSVADLPWPAESSE